MDKAKAKLEFQLENMEFKEYAAIGYANGAITYKFQAILSKEHAFNTSNDTRNKNTTVLHCVNKTKQNPCKKANRLSPVPILLAFTLYDLKEDSTSASSALNFERNLILRSKDIVVPKIWPSKLLISCKNFVISFNKIFRNLFLYFLIFVLEGKASANCQWVAAS